MKGAILLGAAGAVLLSSNAWVLVSVWSNRSVTAGGTAVLTERELTLPGMAGDSTALMLQLQWEVASSDPENDRSADWLDAAKLAELGFDCSVPIASPLARDHYASQPVRLVYVVLEYGSEPRPAPARGQGLRTHLVVVDAGRDPRGLRDKYPDPARHIITRSLVRMLLEDRNWRDGQPLPEPRLRGRPRMLIPNQIFVPKPHCRILQDLRPRGDSHEAGTRTEPRFAVTVSWGGGYEPWVKEVHLLPAAPSSKP